jgi:hypothetical protein
MASFAIGSQSPTDIAASIVQERTIIQQHYDMIRSLRARIAENEQRFEIASSEVHQAIDDGRLSESQAVCNWLIDIDLLDRIEHAGN